MLLVTLCFSYYDTTPMCSLVFPQGNGLNKASDELIIIFCVGYKGKHSTSVASNAICSSLIDTETVKLHARHSEAVSPLANASWKGQTRLKIGAKHKASKSSVY